MRKKFKDLNISNGFLFAAVLEDEETCRMILEINLNRKLPRIKVHAEHSIYVNSGYRSARKDIWPKLKLK